ncbi:MAG: SprB repeat-containing protein [Saprospiraceae bacterium]|nr:SprB repeat-containing protein [Saprospiraceae bacterium]
MFKRIFLLLTVFAAFGSAIQLNAQTCDGPMSVTVAGSSTGLPLTFTSAAVTTPITCFGGTATVTIVVGGGSPAYTYTFNGTSNTTGIFSGVSAGIDLPYSVTDVNNCGPITGTITVTQPAELSAIVASTNVTCNGSNDGTITITSPTGGSGTYEYSINGGTEWQASGSFTGLANATYNVQIRDAANPSCVNTLNAALIITQPAVLNATVASTNVTCNGANDGTITITGATGGYGTYEYSVNGGTNWQTSGSFTGLANGTYNVQIRDAAHPLCVITLNAALVITQPNVLSATVSSTNVTCNGINDGTITISNPAGGYGNYEYSINGGSTWQASGTYTALAPGVYNVQIRDKDNAACVIVLNAALEITQPAAVVINSASVTSNYNGAQVSCAVGQGTSNDGQITVVASGGTAPLEYSKDNGANYQATGIFNGLTAGTYTMVVKDANNCTASAAVTITAPPAIAAGTCDATQDICQLSAGQIKVAASGGTGILNVTWTSTPSGAPGTPSGSNQAIPNTPGAGGFIIYSDLKGGVTYNFVVTDANGCKVP